MKPGPGSVLVAALESMWAGICDEEPAVPRNVIILPSFQAGHTVASFDPHAWRGDNLPYHEVLIDPRAARFDHGALELLLHEAAHGRALTFGDVDTKKGYHNRAFKHHAEALGLVVTRDPRPSVGYRSDLGACPERWRPLRARFAEATRGLPYRQVHNA